jgi:hypothetical protein
VVFGWEKRVAKGDVEASVLLRALHEIEAFLPCKIYVQHVPRVSNEWASLADALSRESSTGARERALLAQLGCHEQKGELWEWLLDPRPDWTRGTRLIQQIENSWNK